MIVQYYCSLILNNQATKFNLFQKYTNSVNHRFQIGCVILFPYPNIGLQLH